MARVVISRALRELIEPQLLPVLSETAEGLASGFSVYARSVAYGPNRSYGGHAYGHYSDPRNIVAGAAMVRGRARGFVQARKFTARFLEGGTSKMAARHPLETYGRQSGLRFRRARAR